MGWCEDMLEKEEIRDRSKSVWHFETLEEIIAYFTERNIPLDIVKLGGCHGPGTQTEDDSPDFFW